MICTSQPLPGSKFLLMQIQFLIILHHLAFTFDFSKRFSKGLPTAPEEPCLGGILADEMGLGKTLEVLSLILHRPYQTDITREPLNNLGAGPCSKKLFAFTTVFHESYEDELMDCSSDSESTKTASTSPHGTFCVCGGSNDDSAADNDEMLTLVHCEVCDSGYYQHEECVQFRRRIHTSGGEPVELVYICPLCWNHVGSCFLSFIFIG